MTQDNTLRWQYRFDNYSRALALLGEAIALGKERPLSQLEKEGIIQRFEYTVELAWKTMHDYLAGQNIVFDQVTPRSVIREAFSAQLIGDGQIWMDALDDRNSMSHKYDSAAFERIIAGITQHYLPAFEALQKKFLSFKSADG